uniref:Uncharacterized protein n=1 Tax=Echeneis naucrates TaxID=173247 RepID=A0A665T4I8_ECHNA
MKLYLAAAVLMLAFVACAEAQDEEVSDKITRFGDRMLEIGRNLVERTKNAVHSIGESERFQSLRDKFQH